MAAASPNSEPSAEPARLTWGRLSTAFRRLLASDEAADAPAEPASPTPRMAVEALLFTYGETTPSELRTSLAEFADADVEQLIAGLNATYQAENAPYEIVSAAGRWRMQLRKEFAPLADRFYGRDRKLKLTSAAVEVLSIVAYRDGADAAEVQRMRGGVNSSALLAKLVRWKLLSIERSDGPPRQTVYRTTDRFHRLLGIATPADLPRPDAWEDHAPSPQAAKSSP